MSGLITDVYGVTEQKGKPVVSSRKVAEVFNKRHSDVLRDIETELKNMEEIGEREFAFTNISLSSYKDSQNKKQPEYILTKSGFMSVALKYQGKKATSLRVNYIKRFDEMEQFIKDLYEAKADFPEFTYAIMAAHEEPKHYHFANELDMINRIVLGMSAKQFKESNNLGKVNSIRPYLTKEQINSIKTLQRIDIGLIYSIPDFQQRKTFLQGYFERRKQLSA